MLGSLRIGLGDGTIVPASSLQTAKTRHLLRLLAIEPHGIRTGVLVDQLWPDVPDQRGRGSLRTAASLLRRMLGGHVVRTGDVLALDDVEVDALRFAADAARAHERFRRRDHRGGLTLAAGALETYRGDLADDEPYLDAMTVPRERLTVQRDELLLAAGHAAMTLGRTREALRYAERLTALDRTREPACRLAMQAYHTLGERSMALRAYERCRRAMTDELGVEPGRETRELYGRILADEPHDADPR